MYKLPTFIIGATYTWENGVGKSEAKRIRSPAFRGLHQILMQSLLVLIMVTSAKDMLSQETMIDSDFQSWNVARLTVPIGERWSLSMQNEARLADNVSELDEYIFKLYAHYKFSKKLGLSFGYKYINRPDASNEHDPWAEIVFPRTYNKWHLSHQIRFEARIYQDIQGILPRVRYLFNWSRQLGNSFMYATGFGAVRFNLVEKRTGPVAGFEQTRVYAGLGFHIGGITRIEVGYLYRYELIRDAPDFSDNVIHLNLFFTIKRNSKEPMPNDHFL